MIFIFFLSFGNVVGSCLNSFSDGAGRQRAADDLSKYVFFSFAALVSRRALAEAGIRMASIRLAVITLPNPT